MSPNAGRTGSVRSCRSRTHCGTYSSLLLVIGVILFGGYPANAQLERIIPTTPSETTSSESSEAQPEESGEEFIETDRNSFTFSPRTAPSGQYIFESAYSNISIGNEGMKHSFPESVLRFGLGDRLELRLGYNFETGPASEIAEGDIAGNFGINAEQQILYGFKYQVTRRNTQKNWLPESAFLLQGHTPVGSVEGQSQIRLGYAWGWTLPNHWTFDSGIRFGTDREGKDGYTLWAPSAVIKIPLGQQKKWFTHLEYFSVMSQAKENDFSKQFVDTGLHYFITPRWEVGAVVGFGINEQTRGTLVNVGCGIRF
jgi:hypothetical protein